jgi:hypothetical protein
VVKVPAKTKPSTEMEENTNTNSKRTRTTNNEQRTMDTRSRKRGLVQPEYLYHAIKHGEAKVSYLSLRFERVIASHLLLTCVLPSLTTKPSGPSSAGVSHENLGMIRFMRNVEAYLGDREQAADVLDETVDPAKTK